MTAARSTAVGVLASGWTLLLALTAMGHLTAARNTLTVILSIATLALLLRDIRALPCKRAIGALVLWATASLLWSAAPDVSLSKLRTDLYLPLFAATAAFYFVREARGLRPIVAGLACGLTALAVLSAFAYLPAGIVPSWLPLEQAGGIVRPLPHWYPGPGDASMYAVLAIAPLTLAWRLFPERRVPIGVAGLLLLFVLFTTNNRNSVVVAPVVFIVQWSLDRRVIDRAPMRRPLWRIGAIVLVVATLGAVLELGARERLTYLHKPLVGDSAALELVATDTRPMIWRYYIARGREHPWTGVGFGRTVPGIGWQTESDRSLAAIEPNAYIHAHNLFINWWLQLGWIGLGLLAVVVAAVVRTARALVRMAQGAPEARWTNHALLATGLAATVRDLSDDFLVFGMATVFCVIVAALLGELSRIAIPQRR